MSAKHTPNKIRREESNARIIDAAIKNFGTYGYSHSSISQIAKDAGVSPGLITNRYSSKEELFEAAFKYGFQEINIDYEKSPGALEFLVGAINSVKELYSNNKDVFDFMAMLYISYDKPESFKHKAREEFTSTRACELLIETQIEGLLQKGDIVQLVDAFLTHTYLQVGVCKKYGLDIPSDRYFLSAILVDNMDNHEFYNRQFMNFLLKEYQSAWLIKLDDLSLVAFTYDNEKAVPNSVETVQSMQTYDEARLWYIENCVVEQSRNQLINQTELNHILSKVADGESYYIEYGRISGGEINYNQLCYNRIVDRNGDIEYIAMGFRNIDIAKRAEIDDLTGLLTRHAFFVKAEELLKENPEVEYDLVISDIVDFKKINETYGVKIADNIIKWVSSYLLNRLGNKALIGRYGGDQAVVLGTKEVISELISEAARDIFFEAERDNGLPEIQNKFGVYHNISHENSIVSTCDKAHMALNSIKRQYDKSIAYYNEEIKHHIDKQRLIEGCMHKSLKDGDFKVYYQPKHDAKTGAMVGAEALIRWIHPEYGFMSPGDFIPLFEQNGFIVENDRFVFRRTCENLKRWKEAGIKTVPISINASKLTLGADDVVDNMKKIVNDNELSAGQIHVEITETLMSHNVEDLLQKLNEIRGIGFKVELDDFGSGYSSINVLSTLPIDILKLDMSFMQQFGDDRRFMVLESCIELAKKLGFETVSEGVELKEQRDALAKLGVDMIQGYYYSRPLPEAEFEKYMLEYI